jgi:hypothetical protein
MDKVIGLGSFGCLVGDELAAYPEYRIYRINSDSSGRGSLGIGSYLNIEEYERNLDSQEVEIYLSSVKKGDEVLLITEGGDPITGALLRILETIQDASVSVMYVCPDRELVGEEQRRDDRIVFNIIQEYARSGAIKNCYLVSYPALEILTGNVPITSYKKSLAYFLAYVTAMINYFAHTEPVIENSPTVKPHKRILSYGVSSLDKSAEVKLLFPLEDVTDLHFFYGIPEESIASDETMMEKIKEHVNSYSKAQDMGVTFSVFSTTLETPIVLGQAYSSVLQKLPERS